MPLWLRPFNSVKKQTNQTDIKAHTINIQNICHQPNTHFFEKGWKQMEMLGVRERKGESWAEHVAQGNFQMEGPVKEKWTGRQAKLDR